MRFIRDAIIASWKLIPIPRSVDVKYRPPCNLLRLLIWSRVIQYKIRKSVIAEHVRPPTTYQNIYYRKMMNKIKTNTIYQLNINSNQIGLKSKLTDLTWDSMTHFLVALCEKVDMLIKSRTFYLAIESPWSNLKLLMRSYTDLLNLNTVGCSETNRQERAGFPDKCTDRATPLRGGAGRPRNFVQGIMVIMASHVTFLPIKS